jgi:hypothetical protein
MLDERGCAGVLLHSGKHIPCGKLPASGKERCPRCQKVTDWEAAEPQRRAERRRMRREMRQADEEFLKNSPLRAINPEYGIKPEERRQQRR